MSEQAALARAELKTNALGALQPQNLAEAMEIARMFAASELVPKDYQGKPGNVLAAIQYGSELGLGAMMSLQSVAVVNGRPALFGDAPLAVCMAHPGYDGIEETSDGDTYTCKVWRRERAADGSVRRREVRGTFSIERAKRAGLWGKSGPWSQYPERMLQFRARSFALRDAFPDALKGIGIAETIDTDGEAVEVTEVTAQAAPPLKGAAALRDRLKGKRAKRSEPEAAPPPPREAQQQELGATDWTQAAPWLHAIGEAADMDELQAIARDFTEVQADCTDAVQQSVADALGIAREGFRK